ncbi:TetR/AcrR family transcriptional regulator [Kroppenstedtia pulmonis]|uniref:TetR/AcrR family transcriptional regulator n=1 Tax=Kroppenstedtia pulmonis TaxID=1380685 RepID=A0A7D4CL29_9BACL|nr:TetR/AcrR family transcriptional regulator [Kroppenstedtia pulmonis]QKG83778.1 TetR/AcrR family transcriptional regulator [Kroppenstedtia pulmonis]
MSKRETKERIYKAALAVFSEKGAAATTREIAKRAHVNEVTLFRHFGNKENLLQSVIERFSTAGMLTEELDAQLTGDLSSDLRFLAHTYLKTALERAEYIRLGIMEASRKELAHTLGEIPKQLTSHLADYFRKLHQQGVICEADYMLMAHIFYGMLFQSVITKEYQTEELNYLDHEEKRDKLIDTIVELFVCKLNR